MGRRTLGWNRSLLSRENPPTLHTTEGIPPGERLQTKSSLENHGLTCKSPPALAAPPPPCKQPGRSPPDAPAA